MSNIKTHKDLNVWKESINLVKKVYELTKEFPKDEIYGLIAQIKRSAVSIPSNIAEGAARNSNKEFMQFLYIALGSVAELETQLILAQELGYCNPEEASSLIEKQRKIILGLIRYLRNSNTSNSSLITHHASLITKGGSHGISGFFKRHLQAVR